MFISFTNCASLPAVCSARAMHASFAELIITASISSATVISSPASSHITEPSAPPAAAEAFTFSSSESSPLSSISAQIRSAVAFVMLAIGTRASALRS